MVKRATIALVTAYVLTLAVGAGQADGAQRFAGGCGPQMFNSSLCSPVRALQINPCSAKKIGDTLQFLCSVGNPQEVRVKGATVSDGGESGITFPINDRNLSIRQVLLPWVEALVFAALLLASFLRWRQTRSGVAALFSVACLLALGLRAVNLPFIRLFRPAFVSDSMAHDTVRIAGLVIYHSLWILAAIAAGVGAVMAIAGLSGRGDGGSREEAADGIEGS